MAQIGAGVGGGGSRVAAAASSRMTASSHSRRGRTRLWMLRRGAARISPSHEQMRGLPALLAKSVAGGPVSGRSRRRRTSASGFSPSLRGPVDRHHVAGHVTVGVLAEVREERATLAEPNPFFVGQPGHVEHLRPIFGEAQEHLHASSVVDAHVVEVHLASDALPLGRAIAPPGAAGALERVGDEVDAHLRHLRTPLQVEHHASR